MQSKNFKTEECRWVVNLVSVASLVTGCISCSAKGTRKSECTRCDGARRHSRDSLQRPCKLANTAVNASGTEQRVDASVVGTQSHFVLSLEIFAANAALFAPLRVTPSVEMCHGEHVSRCSFRACCTPEALWARVTETRSLFSPPMTQLKYHAGVRPSVPVRTSAS
jgi:hypothetical protein